MNPVISFLKKYPTELITFLFVFWGVIGLNRDFTHINILQVYLVETLIVFTLLVIGIRYFAVPLFREKINAQIHPFLIPFVCFGLIGILILFLSLDKGFLAFRQSLIVLYVSFFFIFYFTFQDDEKLRKFLVVTAVVLTLVVGLKILAFEFLGLTHEDEPYRVKHDDVDTIFSSLALIGIVLYFKEFFAKQKILTCVLILLNAVVIFLTVKRTALLGLVVVVLLYLYFSKSRKKILINLLIGLGVFVVIGAGIYFFAHSTFDSLKAIALDKLDVVQERNSVWRTTAWDIAYQKVAESPWFGHGFGQRILGASVGGNQTFDPHNSFLALTFYNGIFMLLLFLGLVVDAVRRFFKAIKQATDETTRKLRMFFLFGLVYMAIFAFFNVTLENQRQSIFFWFFLSGAYFLTKPVPGEQASKPSYLLGNIALVVVVVGMTVCSFLPFNYMRTIPVFSPLVGGQIPQIWNKTSAITLTTETKDIRIDVDGKLQNKQPVVLFWVLTENFYTNVAGHESDFNLVIQLTEPAKNPLTVRLWRKDAADIILPEKDFVTDVGAQTISIPLKVLENPNLDVSQHAGFSIHLPSLEESQSLKISSIDVVDMRP